MDEAKGLVVTAVKRGRPLAGRPRRKYSGTTVAHRLTWLRLDRQLTQSTVAAAIGVRVQTLCGWERGRAEPGIEALRSLAEAYCCPPGWIVDGVGPRTRVQG
jgi:DNA-binding XRE family transcriptional regulator